MKGLKNHVTIGYFRIKPYYFFLFWVYFTYCGGIAPKNKIHLKDTAKSIQAEHRECNLVCDQITDDNGIWD